MSTAAAVALVVAALSLAACDTSAYAFRIDESITIVKPLARSTVELPVVIRWTDDRASAPAGWRPPAEPQAAPDDDAAGYYGVFVDRAPLGPGERLASLLDDEGVCERTPGCQPDEVQLRDRGVVLASTPTVTIEFLADLRPSQRASDKDPHEVTIVRMLGDTRVGEAAFTVTYFVRR